MALYILGSLNGSYESLKYILLQMGLVDPPVGLSQLKWKKGCNDMLIQMGDVIGEHKGSHECYMTLRALQKEAKEYGGQVIRLMGDMEYDALSKEDKEIASPLFSKIMYLLKDKIRKDILNHTLVGSCQLGGKWLLTHSGVSQSTFDLTCLDENEYSLKTVSREINYMLHKFTADNDFDEHVNKFFKNIFSLDFEHGIFADVNQITGHNGKEYIAKINKKVNVSCRMHLAPKRGNFQVLKLENNTFKVISFGKELKPEKSKGRIKVSQSYER
jgi:hypothetical protein